MMSDDVVITGKYCCSLGKIGAQCGHASVGAYQKAMDLNPSLVRRWDESGCAKICVRVESETDLKNLRKGANVRGLNYYLVHDAGRTQVRNSTFAQCKSIFIIVRGFRLLLEVSLS